RVRKLGVPAGGDWGRGLAAEGHSAVSHVQDRRRPRAPGAPRVDVEAHVAREETRMLAAVGVESRLLAALVEPQVRDLQEKVRRAAVGGGRRGPRVPPPPASPPAGPRPGPESRAGPLPDPARGGP